MKKTMIGNQVKFSVIIPTYNRANIISKTISSIINQSYRNIEIIVIDDGSTDNTKTIIEQFNDDRLKYFWKSNEGRTIARNHGLSLATGDYINYIDSDDYVLPNHFVLASEFILKNNPDVFHTSYKIVNEKNELISIYKPVKNINQELLKGNLLACLSVIIRKEVAQEYKWEKNRDLTNGEDWLLWLKISSKYTILQIPVCTTCVVNHSQRSVFSFNENRMLKSAQLLKQYLIEDEYFINKNGKLLVNRIYGHMLTYIALHAVLANNKLTGFQYFLKGFFYNPNELFSRRTLGIIKHSLIGFFK